MTSRGRGISARATDAWRTAVYFSARGPRSAGTYVRWRWKRLTERLVPPSYTVSPADLGVLLAGGLPGRPSRADPAELAAHFRERANPRSRFDETERETVVGLVAEADRRRTIAAAAAIEGGRFSFRGMPPQDLDSPIDWQTTPEGNLDWRWDLNRHRYLETLGRAYWYDGDERHAAAIGRLLSDWLAANPSGPGGAAWSSVFEVAIRVDSWLAGFHLVRRSPSLDDAVILAIVAGLLTHGRFLAANLEHHVPNNHLLLEAKALMALGLLLPEAPDAGGWYATGGRIIERELRRQVCSDGGHAERTPLYHRMITGELLELAVLHERNGLQVPESLAQALPAMIDFEVAMSRPDGSISLFSDSVQGDSGVRFTPATAGPAWLAAAATATGPGPVPETDAWLLGPRAAARASEGARPGSRAFPVTGFATMRSDADDPAGPSLLVFDCGPFGYRAMPTHGHADALSFELFAAGRTWITDAGGYNLHLGSGWRDYFRSTRAHNTVVVDDLDQTILLDGRRAFRPAEGRLRRWSCTPDVDLAEADHDGYMRLDRPVRHARTVVALRDGTWLLVDALLGQGQHRYQALFHLASDLVVEPVDASGAVGARDPAGASRLSIVPADADLWRVDVIRGAMDPVQGWVSVESGRREAASVVRYGGESELPLRFAFLLSVAPSDAPTPRLTLVEGTGGACRLRVERTEAVTEVSIDTAGIRVDRHPGARAMA